jgi:thioredoxin reductase
MGVKAGLTLLILIAIGFMGTRGRIFVIFLSFLSVSQAFSAECSHELIAERYKVAIVGLGVHSTLLLRESPTTSMIAIEKGAAPSHVFGELGPFFNIATSIPLEDLKTNEDLEAYFQKTANESSAQILYHTEVFSLEETKDGYRLKLDKGTIDAQYVILSTGSGKANHIVPNADTFDEMAQTALEDLKQNRDPLSRHENQKIAIVGPGNGAKFILEFLLGLGPQKLYTQRPTGTSAVRSKIQWFVGKNTDPNTLWSERFTPLKNAITKNADIEIVQEDFDASRLGQYEFVAQALGYENVVPRLLPPGHAPLQEIRAKIPGSDLETIVAKRTGGIFIIGAAAYPFENEEDRKHGIHVNPTLEELIPRTKAFTDWFGNFLKSTP